MVDLHHFYHIYCGLDSLGAHSSWVTPVETHIKALKKYGLHNKLAGMYVGLVGRDEDRQHVKNFLDYHKIKYELVAESDSGWEQVTQDKLWDFSQLNDGRILYAHSKGSFNTSVLNSNWMRSMTYYNIVKWKDCIKHLDDYDAVGAYWYDFSNDSKPTLGQPHTGQKWFAGTYWWSKLNRIKDIGHGPTMNSRWDAEVWIGKVPEMSVYSLSDGGAAGELIEW